MGKYEPLGQFLKRQKRDRVPMTFAEIERILGARLPASKKSRSFWSNNPDNNVMTKAWLEAGFVTSEIESEAGTLVFTRQPRGPTPAAKKGNWDAIFGCMKGMITLAPGVDLTEPAFTDKEMGEIEKNMIAPLGLPRE